MTDASSAQSTSRRAGLFGSAALSHALPFLILLAIGLALPLFAGGYWGVIAQRACVYYASTDRPMQVNAPVCVDWLADGQPHVVRVPLRGQPGWARQVSHLRLNPFAAGSGIAGVELWTRNPRLVP